MIHGLQIYKIRKSEKGKKVIQNEVGDRIRELRKSQNLSQEKLATIAGLDRTYIASVENGKRNISIVNIEKITKALNVSLSDFFYGI